jgi:hypothetical protein
MAMNLTLSKPAATTYTVEDLVRLVKSGAIRVPSFQRPLRWGWEDVRRLFDSILKGYPVGSLLLWKREARQENIKIGALSIDAPGKEDALWVVDGQQRLTSLANALSEESQKDPRFSFAYDFKNSKLVRSGSNAGSVIPLPVLFDLRRLIPWFREHPDAVEYDQVASAITKILIEYRIPAYVVEQDDEAVLRDIFDRMNNYGKRLSRAEVFAALHPGTGSQQLGTFERIIDEIATERNFGQLDDDTVLSAVLARRGSDVTREIRNEFSARKAGDFTNETEGEAYQQGGEALKRAVAFLQDDAGVPHLSLLSYRYLLVVLARFFSHFPEPEKRNRELLLRWYWRAALAGPRAFTGSWNEAMRVLAARVVPGNETQSVQDLLSLIPCDVRKPDLLRFRPNQADSRVVLCALWDHGPRSLATGALYTRQDLADCVDQRTSARAALTHLVRNPPKEMRSSAGNWCFFLEEVARPFVELLARPSSTIDLFADDPSETAYEEVLDSHCLSTELLSLLETGETERFLRDRQAIVQQVVERFITRNTGAGFEDTPPLDELDLDDDEFEGDADEQEA